MKKTCDNCRHKKILWRRECRSDGHYDHKECGHCCTFPEDAVLKLDNLQHACENYVPVNLPDTAECEPHGESAKTWLQELEEERRSHVPNTLEDFSIGDVVTVSTSNPHNLRAHGLPGYLTDGTLKVIGFTREKVKCDWDGGKPFNIPPELLKK